MKWKLFPRAPVLPWSAGLFSLLAPAGEDGALCAVWVWSWSRDGNISCHLSVSLELAKLELETGEKIIVYLSDVFLGVCGFTQNISSTILYILKSRQLCLPKKSSK